METIRQATETEKARNGFGPNGEAICSWCGNEAEHQFVVRTQEPFGPAFYSPAYCSAECRTEAIGG